MATNYPEQLDTFTIKIDDVHDVMADDINVLQDAIHSIQTVIGLLPQDSHLDIKTRLEDIELNIGSNTSSINSISDSIGAPNGIAVLDNTGNVPLTQLGNVEGMELHNNEWHSVEYSTLILGDTSITAHRGDHGLAAYNHTGLNNNPHAVTKEQVGLGNVRDEDIRDYGLGESNFPADNLNYATGASGLGAGFYSVSLTDSAIVGSTSNGNNIAIGVVRVSGPTPASVYVNHTYANVWQGKTELWHEGNLTPSSIGAEDTIIAGTADEYWRGDKTWQALLGTTSTTAYRGDHGLLAYSHSQAAHAPSDANNYTHPANHPPSIITQDDSNRFVTDTEKSTWNTAYDYSQVGHLPLVGGTLDGILTSRPDNNDPLFNFVGKNNTGDNTDIIRFGSAQGLGISGASDQYEVGFLITTTANPRRFFLKTTGGTAELRTDYLHLTEDITAGGASFADAIGVNVGASDANTPTLYLSRNNDGVDATLLEMDIASNTTTRYFMTCKGSSGVVNFQVSTNGTLQAGDVPWARLSGEVSVTAGNGLSGGGVLSATRTLTLGTPATCTNATDNGVTASSHTHAVSGFALTAHTHANLVAGAGLVGTTYNGGTAYTWTLGTPSTCTPGTSNANTASSHTHALSGLGGFTRTSIMARTAVSSSTNYNLGAAITTFDLILIRFTPWYSSTTYNSSITMIIDPADTNVVGTQIYYSPPFWIGTLRAIEIVFNSTTQVRVVALGGSSAPRMNIVGLKFAA